MEWRPLTAADVPAVYALEAAGEAFDDGVVEVTEDDIEGDWERPDFRPESMSMGGFVGGDLVAYAEVFQGRAEALVHPDHRGKGLGTHLARWSWEVVRAEGRHRVGQTISDNETAAAALFAGLGYERGHTAWILRIPLAAGATTPPLPPGYRFRLYRPEVDDFEMYTLIDEAFAEWRGADSESMGFDNWAACTLRGVSPSFVVLLEHDEAGAGTGRLVGAAVARDFPDSGEGWIEQVAVRREHRGRGLGGALLAESFSRFRAAGRTGAGLSTDSRTGALGLYQHAGMAVVRSYTRWVKTGL